MEGAKGQPKPFPPCAKPAKTPVYLGLSCLWQTVKEYKELAGWTKDEYIPKMPTDSLGKAISLCPQPLQGSGMLMWSEMLCRKALALYLKLALSLNGFQLIFEEDGAGPFSCYYDIEVSVAVHIDYRDVQGGAYAPVRRDDVPGPFYARFAS